MKTKDSSTYVCMATMTRKYIVASVMIVRTNAENLSELLRWEVYQMMTMNADNSKYPAQYSLAFYINEQNESGRVPKTVPIEFGTNMSWRSILTGHRPAPPIRSGGRVMMVGGWRTDTASDMVILANIRVPKYDASILFLKVITYTLGRSRINRPRDK